MKFSSTCDISESKLKDIKKELASDNVLMTAYLILEEVNQLKTNLTRELDLQRDRRQEQERQFRELLSELQGALDQIRAKHLIEANLLDLIGEPNAGDQKKESDSSGNSGGASIEAALVSHVRRRGLRQNSTGQPL